tara:strand:- start:1211 stop:2887 length:1677 start_codon:yes stop_codon:yes gene_type:complete
MSIRDFKNKIGKLAGKDLLNDVDKKLQKGTEYKFLSGYVKEIITNPYDYLNRPYRVNDQTVYNEVTIKDVLSGRVTTLPGGESVKSPIKNFEHVANMPMNSSIVQIVDDGRGGDGEKPVICYPFFPSHFSLPLKVGEYVWMIEENIKGVINYYWMCRKTGIIQVEDLNFTNLERTSINTAMYDKHEESAGVFVPSSETKEKMISLAKSEVSNIAEESYSNLLKNSFNHVTEFVGEAVPRMKKRSSDLLFQGSNNSGIHLTVEKFSDLSENNTEESLNDGYVSSPAIDIFIKRDPGLDSIKTKNFSDADEGIEHEEINKIRDLEGDTLNNVSDELLDTDPLSAASRIYMSNNSNFDEDFGLDIDNLDTQSGTCIISYTKNNRLVGTDNTRVLNITGESYIDMTSSGNIVIKASKNNGQEFISLNPDEKYARINTRKNGNIYFTHQGTNNLPTKSADEPYVLVSQLEPILENIYAILNAHNTTFFTLVPARFPPFIAAAAQAVQTALIDTKIDTPFGKYLEPINIPVAAAPLQGGVVVGQSILRSGRIIADDEKDMIVPT